MAADVETGLDTRDRPARLDPAVLGLSGLGALAGGLIVAVAVHRDVWGDFTTHLALTKAGINGAPFPGDFLFYWLEACLTGFTPSDTRLLVVLIALLAVCSGVKVYLTAQFAAAEGGRLSRLGLLLVGAFFFAYGVPIGAGYPAFIPPNVWHNSTTTMVMPMAIGLFWASLRYLRAPSARLLGLMFALVALNIATKPSFVLCWLIAFPIAVFIRDRRLAAQVGPVLVCLGGGVLLAAQYAYIYVWGRGDPSATPSTVRIAPFHVWSLFTDDIPLSFVVSYAFPILAVLVGDERVRRSLAVRYAAGLAAVGLLWFILLTETGFREPHGNFLWQAIITNYLLYAAVLSAVIAWLRATRFGWRQYTVLALFAVQVGTGLHYLYVWTGGLV